MQPLLYKQDKAENELAYRLLPEHKSSQVYFLEPFKTIVDQSAVQINYLVINTQIT